MLVQTCLNEATLPESIFRRAVDMKDPRYALSDQTKQSLRDLAETMKHDRPSKEWTELKAALNDRDAVNSRNVFLAAENYLRGREGVSSDPKRRIGFSAALKAVALAAENGDAVAKERAKILVEHINTVRKTQPGQPNYVDLKDYAPKKSAALEHQPEAMPEV